MKYIVVYLFIFLVFSKTFVIFGCLYVCIEQGQMLIAFLKTAEQKKQNKTKQKTKQN